MEGFCPSGEARRAPFPLLDNRAPNVRGRMMSASNPNTESLFAAALAMESPEERANYLDQACGADQQLKAQVEELLAAYPKVERFLESPLRDAVATIGEPAVSEGPGTVIGPYKLLQQIGEGGMGTVFM